MKFNFKKMNLAGFQQLPRLLRWAIIAVAVILILKMTMAIFYKENPLEIVGTVTVKRTDMTLKVDSTGEVKPYNRVEIKSPIGGRVEEVLVNEGDLIKQGQILAWMSSTERATLLDAARVKGEKDYKYWQEAYKPAPLISPLNGTLIVRSVEPGQTVAATNPVVVVADRLIVEALVDETDLAQIKLGQRVEITLDSYPDKPIMGKVLQISYESTLVNNVNVYTVDIDPDQATDLFRSGMTANVTFIVAELKGVLAVPSEAVMEWPRGVPRPKGAEFAVYVKTFTGKLKPVPVKIGRSDGRLTEIKEGLSEGMKLQLVRKKQVQSSSPFSPFGQQQKGERKGK